MRPNPSVVLHGNAVPKYAKVHDVRASTVRLDVFDVTDGPGTTLRPWRAHAMLGRVVI